MRVSVFLLWGAPPIPAGAFDLDEFGSPARDSLCGHSHISGPRKDGVAMIRCLFGHDCTVIQVSGQPNSSEHLSVSSAIVRIYVY